MTGEEDADARLVADHIAALDGSRDARDRIEAQYLGVIPTADAVAYIREKALKALAGKPTALKWLDVEAMRARVWTRRPPGPRYRERRQYRDTE